MRNPKAARRTGEAQRSHPSKLGTAQASLDLLVIGRWNICPLLIHQEGVEAGSWRYWHFSPRTHPEGILQSLGSAPLCSNWPILPNSKESAVMSPMVLWTFNGAEAAIHVRVGCRVTCSFGVFKNKNTTIQNQYR